VGGEERGVYAFGEEGRISWVWRYGNTRALTAMMWNVSVHHRLLYSNHHLYYILLDLTLSI